MKKLIFPFIIFALCPSISGCSSNANKIVTINTYSDSRYININYHDVCNLIDSKQQFLLESYSPYCSTCIALQAQLDKYVDETENLIYRLNYFDYGAPENETPLKDKYPEIFGDDLTPKLMFIKNGALTYNIPYDSFKSYTRLSNLIRKRLISSKIYLASTLRDYEYNFKLNGSNYLVYFYDIASYSSVDTLNRFIFESNENYYKKNIILFNIKTMGGELQDFMADYDIKSTTSAILFGEQIKTTNYALDGGLELKEMLSSL